MDDFNRIEMQLRLSRRQILHYIALKDEDVKNEIEAALDNYDKEAIRALVQEKVEAAVNKEIEQVVRYKVINVVGQVAEEMAPGIVQEVAETTRVDESFRAAVIQLAQNEIYSLLDKLGDKR